MSYFSFTEGRSILGVWNSYDRAGTVQVVLIPVPTDVIELSFENRKR